MKSVSQKSITYTDEFKRLFIAEYKSGRLPREIFESYGFDIGILRKANPYRRMTKATHEHRVLQNELNRKFKQGVPGKVLLTDITYLFYGKERKHISLRSKMHAPMKFWLIWCREDYT